MVPYSSDRCQLQLERRTTSEILPRIPGEHKILFKGRTLVCVGIPQLQAALLRSGAVPLNIRIESRNEQAAAVSMTLSAISVLLGEPVSNRIERLVIDCPSLVQMSISRDIIPGPFTLLGSIGFNASLSPWSLSMFRAVSSTSTLLKHVQVDCEITAELANLQVWSRIQEVSLRLVRSRVVAQDLNKISHKLSNLIQFTKSPISWPSQDTPVSVWRNIHKINLACDPTHLARLKLPALSSLSIRDLRDWDEEYAMEGFAPVSYPLLDDLTVITSGPRWLSKVSAPLLRHCHIDRDVNSGAAVGRGWESSPLFLGLKFPAVRELTFGALVGSEAMISGLKYFPNIGKLNLLSPYKDPILAVLLLLGSYTPVHCPHLKKLCLGDEDDRVEAFKKDIVPEVKRLIKSRKQMGKPLFRLSAHWLRDQGVPQIFISAIGRV